MFTSVLIANRGEIACRVARTARRLGMKVIAVYSEADAEALHVKQADKAVLIGPAPVTDSYLKAQTILDVAVAEGAQCIHPGYGFLSENADFAEACEAKGIAFVGPPASSIRAMGAKDAAKDLMEKAGVPVVPGYQGPNQDPDFLKSKARETGYPVMIKAVSGGGGKGMRRVDRHNDFDDALQSCRREAASAFGDERVLIEKFVSNPRHIEIQVFADSKSDAVHLFERDCSLQRRHQKVIEEAPAPGMPDAVRDAMGNAAVAAAKAVDYRGAGTVEFIVDGSGDPSEDGFYFMEMNTRLQVEHPVTEMITGLDLVEWQFRVAAGEALPLPQKDIAMNGHAVEARVYAEDPANGFLPQTGVLQRLQWPGQVPGLRIDSAVEQGAEVTSWYDPMIAKVIVHADTRDEALDNLARALERTELMGLRSNVRFLSRLINDDVFRAGKMDTGLIDSRIDALTGKDEADLARLAAVACWFADKTSSATGNPWTALKGWSPVGVPRHDIVHLDINNERVVCDVNWLEDGYSLSFRDGDKNLQVSDENLENGEFTASADGKAVSVRFVVQANGTGILALSNGFHFAINEADLLDRDDEASDAGGVVKAPMPGKVITVNVGEGDEVEHGEALLVLEAMKMEHTLKAGCSGTVSAVHAMTGAQVAEGDLLISLEAAEET